MARKVKEVTITTEGRDQGKVFVITEMPASRAEKWAMRALLIVGRRNPEIEHHAGMGMQGVAALGLKAVLGGIDWDEAEPLVDEMMECVSIKESAPGKPSFVRHDLMEEDIEEVATRLLLRTEVFQLHTGFLLAGDQSKSTSDTPATTTPTSSNT